MANPTQQEPLRNRNSIEPREVRVSLRTKLFLLVLIPFLLLIAALVAQIRLQASSLADRIIADSLQQSKFVLDSRIRFKLQSLHDLAAGIARDARVLPAVISGDSSSLQDLSLEFQDTVGFDILIVTDSRGNILARSDDEAAIGRQVNRSSLFGSPLGKGERAQGFMLSSDSLYLIVAVPVFDNVAVTRVRGSVALAVSLGADVGDEIKALTKAEVVAFALDPGKTPAEHSIGATLFDTSSRYAPVLTEHFTQMPALLQQAYSPQARWQRLRLADEEVTMLLYPLRTASGKPVGFIAALRSSKELLRPFAIIQNTTLLASAASMLLACLLSAFVANRFSRPILDLAGVARDIQQGDYRYESPPARSDEVGVLADAMFHMARGLREKSELENYLAVISDQVEETFLETKAILAAASPESAEAGDAAADIPPGLFEDRYRIIKQLGSGGFASVFLAEDRELGELVALKALHSTNLTGEQLESLRHEVRLARRITHRNIVRIFDIGTSGARTFISMEYIEGCTLEQLVATCGPLKPRMGLLMARQLCWALSTAHREGVVHRDLKPQNLIIDRKGVLKIMDFGIAKFVSEADPLRGEATGSEADAPELHKGRILATMPSGSPRYMAPEQFDSLAGDFRSDVYSTGIILFYLFSGTLPFAGENSWGLMYQHIEVPAPRLKERALGINPEIDAIVERALRKNPEDRFQSMQEMAEALESIA